jgi:N-acetylglucosaminyldiphosphoundecaprenol N-acetyl-beta-D-mannosaminyltransferase
MIESPSNYINILGLKINLADFNSITALISEAIHKKNRIKINYVNAYSIVIANKNKAFKNSLLNTNIVHADGTGIWLARKILFKDRLIKRFNWTDCGYDFLKLCEEKQWTIFFLGSTDDIQIKAKKNLKEKYPALKLEGSFNGYGDLNRKSLIEEINKLNVDILYVGLGTPKQEIWINENFSKLNCKVIQAVGDLFSLFAEEKVRGPKIFQKIGLEWLFRLIRHPGKYFHRYVIGIPVFIFKILNQYMKK